MKGISIDIGSTWTKGALFQLDDKILNPVRRVAHPTTPDNLSEGFSCVLNDLLDSSDGFRELHNSKIHLAYSSSAKGGLAVAALGIVPEITLECARLAAYSAGARITQVFSYRLTRADIRALEDNPPDILLFAGGTDGGHVEYVLANAEAIGKSKLSCSIVYAGNRDLSDDIAEILADKDLTIVENVLPSMDNPNPDPAREALRTIFLSKIVKGKGLDIIVAKTGIEPLPTPYSVYDFSRTIAENVPGWSDFILLDLGGATTDIYSAHRQAPTSGVIFRGLPEPEIKRSVEGDLGLRVSAQAAAASVKTLVADALERQGDRITAFAHYIERVSQQPDYLPIDDTGQLFDSLLAGACVAQACGRHAGRTAEAYTADGKVLIQTGRDLTQVKKIIGSGGWLAHSDSFNPEPWLRQMRIDGKGKTVLLPQHIEYYRDDQYLFPLLANMARQFPEAAANGAIAQLVPHQ